MGIPTHRHNQSRTHTRRAHHALKAQASIECPKCKAPAQSHRVCASCGSYRGRQVVISKDAVRPTTKTEAKKDDKAKVAPKSAPKVSNSADTSKSASKAKKTTRKASV